MNKRAALVAAAGVGLALVALVLFLSLGYRLFTVMSPSMGVAAPVGTLVVAHPAADYHVNDVITFTRGARVYTHRIVAQLAHGSFTTQGDLNSVPDAAPVAVADIIGKAVWTVPGLGWVLTGLPWIVAGFLLVYLLTLIGKIPRTWRWALRISGWTLVLCVVAFWLRPWLNIDLLGFRPADHDPGVLMHVVNTGLFPIDAEGTRLLSGQDAVVHVTDTNEWGFYRLIPTPALDWGERIVLFAACLVPLLLGLLVKPDPQEDDELANDAERPYRRRTVLVLILGAVIAAVGVMNTTMAHAAITAKVRNSADSAGAKQFFNCHNAITSLSKANTFFAFAMSPTGTTETDLSGNSRTGRYMTAPATSSNVGCLNDPAASVAFNGNQCVYMNSATNASQTNPNTFSIEAWFRTSTKSNGRIIGFGSSLNTATDGNYDRHIYLDQAGRIVFGVYPGVVKIVYTAAGKDYADNKWHHVVATLSSAGQFLYVDGQLAMKNTAVTSGENITGYWKVGCGPTANWQNAATAQSGSGSLDYSGPAYFTGQIQYAAVYGVALTPQQVNEHYLAGQR